MQSVGVIRELMRYPVKSMQGEALDSAELTLQGFAEDRRYAFVQAASRSSFPWLTARELPELLYYRTSVEKAARPMWPGRWRRPTGRIGPLTATNSAKRSRRDRAGRSFCCATIAGYTMLRLSPSSAYKRFPKSRKKRNEGKFVALPSQSAGGSGGCRSFDELQWVGKILRIGSAARIAVTEVDRRCVMITLDPATGESCPEILKCVVQKHAQCAGIYATASRPAKCGPAIQSGLGTISTIL